MNTNQVISLMLAIVAVVLLVSPDSVIDKNTTNKNLKMVYDNAMPLGLLSAGLAYYLYTRSTTRLPLSTSSN